MDPVTAFAMAQGALTMIRKGVDFYKECKHVGADVAEITNEVTGHIGKFMDAADVVKQAAEEQKKVVPKKGEIGLNSKALDNVMRARQIIQAETELRETLIYQTPELGGIWSEFEAERARLRKLQNEAEAAEKAEEERKRIEAIKKAKKRRDMWKRYQIDAVIGIGAVIIAGTFGIAMVYVAEDRIEKYPHLGTELIPKRVDKIEPKYIYIGR